MSDGHITKRDLNRGDKEEFIVIQEDGEIAAGGAVFMYESLAWNVIERHEPRGKVMKRTITKWQEVKRRRM